MERKFILSAESTMDLPYSYVQERDISVIFYKYIINDVEYVDDMGKDPESLPSFYKKIAEGALPSTSLINQETYKEYFEELIQKGDILHIAFTSGQSASVGNAIAAAQEIQEKYPEKVIKVIDSLCSSSGYGLLVDYAADLADEGKTLDEVYDWVMANRNKVHHQFFTSDMSHFKRTGRVSGPTAAIATILNICPIMRLDDKGRIIAYDKVRGKKKVIAETIKEVLKHADGGADYNKKVFISSSNSPEDAEMVKTALEDAIPNIKGKIKMCDIGTIIGSHAGKGTVAIFFMGDERAPE